LFPEDLRREFGKDAAKYRQYYQDNLEYLRPGARGFAVDEDVKKLGVSNRQVELLERCIRLLEQGEQQELALRVLKRYTTEDFAAGAQWRAWLEKNRPQLFFTDTGGFKFKIAPETSGVPGAPAKP